MITSSANHYLRAEYLSPIQESNSIELDSKKSPLALLAQTCSSIGSDGNPVSGQKSPGPIDKSQSKGKCSPGDKSPYMLSSDEVLVKNSSFKPYEKDEDRTTPKRISPGAKSPGAGGHHHHHRDRNERTTSRNSEGRNSSRSHEHTSSTAGGRGSSPLNSKASLTPSSLLELSDSWAKDPLAAYRLHSGLYNHAGLGLDLRAAAGLSSLTTKMPHTTASNLNSHYITYAKVKTINGSEVIIPICRDPYCSGCQVNAHAIQVVNGACPPACTQCAQVAAHTKTLSSISSSLIPTIPSSTLNSLYPSVPLSSPPSAHQPLVCNWIDPYCGKRFSNSEDLLQHLRTHTTSVSEASSLSIPPIAHHPLLGAHPSLTRGYPSPPLSPLSAAAAARYHPYTKSLAHLQPSVAALSAASLSSLAPHPLSAYYNPYSLYARGLGSSVGLHP